MNSPRRLARLACLLCLAATVAACATESEVDTSLPAPTITAAETSTTTTSVSGTASVDFDLVIGENSGADTMVEVRLGTTVTLNVTTDLDGDEVHIHGYDLYLDDLMADEPASITFVADQAGKFEVESHETGEVLMVLRVT